MQNSHTIKENLTKKCSQAQCKTYQLLLVTRTRKSNEQFNTNIMI